MAMREIGRGRTTLESFCGLMDMLPPVRSPSYHDHSQHRAMVSMECASENMLAASAYLHDLHDVEPTTVIDVHVSCDGTWSKRGFTATHGVIVVISMESGQVLDFQILSKHCSVCARKKGQLGESSETHQEMNHSGSSDCEGALEIWKQSEEKLRFTNMTCDRDSKTIATLNAEKPYDEEHKCV